MQNTNGENYPAESDVRLRPEGFKRSTRYPTATTKRLSSTEFSVIRITGINESRLRRQARLTRRDQGHFFEDPIRRFRTSLIPDKIV
jgi:hypothetical protein